MNKDKILNILKYWHKVEHFSPYEPDEINSDSFHRVHILNENCLPWKRECQQERLFIIYMGIFSLKDTIKIIENNMGKADYNPEDSQSNSCICTFKLNNDVKYCEYSFRLSALPWAVSKVINKDFNPDTWSESFNSFENKLISIIKNQQEWNFEELNKVKKLIVSELGWEVKLNDVWMYIDEVKIKKDEKKLPKKENNESSIEVEKQKDEKEEEDDEEFNPDEELLRKNELLNSFYIRDLEKVISAVQDNNFGLGFSNLINGEAYSKKRIDIENNVDEIKKIVSPKNIPLGRWASDNNLSLMQQVAVNLAKSKETDRNCIFSVNGPPGTGKTTLLRDIIASVVVDRAVKLSTLSSPSEAFIPRDTITLKTGYGYLKVFELKEGFRDFGIVVTSNNNGAVQNITQELPGIKAIPEKYINTDKYDYFSTEANYIYSSDSWALFCAVLVNNKNCKKFSEKFWNTDDKDPSNKGMKVKLCNDATIKPDWNDSVDRFVKKYNKVLSERDKLIKIEKDLNLYSEIKSKIENTEIEKRSGERDLKELTNSIVAQNKKMDSFNDELNIITELLRETEKGLTVFRRILFFTDKTKKIKEEIDSVRHKRMKELEAILSIKNLLHNLQHKKDELNKIIKQLDSDLDRFRNERDKIKSSLDSAEEILGANFPDNNYWDDFKNNESAQINCPWIYKDFNILREELFLEALELHKSFVLNSYEMKQNLNLFYNLLQRNFTYDDEVKYSSTLFQSFFLLVPVISTTFASIGRLFRHIGREEIGWLLIDEAGQGTPQSAAGAVWRAKRTIIVGDPLQIEPVVTIPQNVLNRFGELYNVEQKYLDKTLSIQSYADEINMYGTNRVFFDSELWIGCPLRVHRRCISPMFDISNYIAYNGKMICATKKPEREFLIKKSMWCNVYGTTDNPHYVPEQGKYIYNIVCKEFIYSKGKEPSIFIITPFTTVKDGLKSMFYENDRFYNFVHEHYPDVKKDEINKWIYRSIGTVHTFQGKEAETVIFCLGVDSREKEHGAITWASSKPNILNVAASRAKYRFIIVGDETLWSDKQNFKDAYRLLKA